MPTLPKQEAPTLWRPLRTPVFRQLLIADVMSDVEYVVDQEHAKAFVRAMHRYERVRRRDGASRWGIFRDVEHAEVYLETFLVTSWAEHLRQHERLTRGDRDLEGQLHRYARREPNVRHLIYVEAES